MGISGFEIETPPQIANAHLRSLYQHWRELALAAGGLPPIQAFDPLHLPKALPHIWIVEIEGSSHRFRVRLAARTSTQSTAATSAASISAMCMPRPISTPSSRAMAAASVSPR